MTVAIAVHAKDTIIFASDSKNTDGDTQSFDAKKIHIVEFKNLHVLVAQSGFSSPSNAAIEALKEIAKDAEISCPLDIQKATESAIFRARKRRTDSHAPYLTEQEKNDDIAYAEFSLMVGFFWNRERFVFSSKSGNQVITDSCTPQNASIGFADSLARYFLAEYCIKERLPHTAIATAVYIIKTVEKHVPHCGGPVQLSYLARVPETTQQAWKDIGKPLPEALGNQMRREELQSYETELARMEEGIRAMHHLAMVEMFSAISQRRLDEVNKLADELNRNEGV